MGINKVQYGNTTLIDLTDTTAVASDVASGKYFYGKDGVKTEGTATGGGSVTQDQDGYIVLPSDGGGGGGGSSSYTLICSEEYEASTTSTSTTVIGTMSGTYENPYKSILYIQVRDKAGKRNGYFLGYNCYWQQPVAGSQLNNYRMTNVLITNTSGAVVASSTSQYGVFPATPQFSNGTFSVNISTRYNSSYSGTIDGTYVVDIYSLQYPDNISPYE